MRAFAVAALLLVSGCATSGTQISANQMASMEKGKTTYTEVIARLGKPFMDTVNGDSTRTVVYNFSKMTLKGATFIPVVGLFAGGAKVDGSVVTFNFDGAGILKDYSSSTTHADTRNGN